MKLLYLSAASALGGAEISLLEILASIKIAQPDWELGLISGQHGRLIERARALGVSTTVVPFPDGLKTIGDSSLGSKLKPNVVWQFFLGLFAAFTYRLRLRRAIANFSPDLIHTNGFKMHVFGILSRQRDTPVVWHMHDYLSSRTIMRKLLSLYSRDCAHIITNSKSVSFDVEKVLERNDSVTCVYNAIDLEDLRPTGPKLDLDMLAGLTKPSPNTVRIGLLATFARWKGHEVYLRAISLLPQDVIIRAYIIGGPVYQTDGSQHSTSELRDLAERLGVSDRVAFTGFVEDRAEALRSLDIVVHASTQPEPFGMVIAESMACGLPIIVAGSGGVNELVLDGVNALKHRPGDASSLAQALIRLIRDPRLRSQLGKAARLAAEHLFTRSRLADELVSVYNFSLHCS